MKLKKIHNFYGPRKCHIPTDNYLLFSDVIEGKVWKPLCSLQSEVYTLNDIELFLGFEC